MGREGFLSSKVWNSSCGAYYFSWNSWLRFKLVMSLHDNNSTIQMVQVRLKRWIAINEAGIKPEDVDYVNAHGKFYTCQWERWKRSYCFVLVKKFPASTEITGHLLGAAGAAEAIATIEAIRHSFVPKLLVPKNCLTISKQTLFMVKVKKRIFSMLSQIPLVLRHTRCSGLLNVGGLIHEYFWNQRFGSIWGVNFAWILT